MKAYLAELVAQSPSPVAARNRVREALQAKILQSLQRSGGMIPLAFHGGTALRFLYAIGRFSEDLDFALERQDSGFDFRAYIRSVRADLMREGYEIDVKLNDRKVVHSSFIRFPGLVFELGLSPHRSEVLAVKVEVDTRPPHGAVLETTVIRRHEILHLQHHDRASLLAGKLHAVLQRRYTKGRDLYDLIWYLSDPSWPPPNLAMLNNALAQSGWSDGELTEESWREPVRDRLEGLDWKMAADDVRSFLESPREADLLTLDNAVRALG